MAQSDGSGNKKVLVIILVIVLGVPALLAVVGCLAAIAVPAFVKYLQRSKAVEASAVVETVADQAKLQYEEDCEMPPELPALTDPQECCGGEQCAPKTSAAAKWEDVAFSPPDGPTYFSYETEHKDASTYLVRARSDFHCGGPMHTYEVEIDMPDDGSCRAEIGPAMVSNELE